MNSWNRTGEKVSSREEIHREAFMIARARSQALQGRDVKAQGAALGLGAVEVLSPERAKPAFGFCCVALTGLGIFRTWKPKASLRFTLGFNRTALQA